MQNGYGGPYGGGGGRPFPGPDHGHGGGGGYGPVPEPGYGSNGSYGFDGDEPPYPPQQIVEGTVVLRVEPARTRVLAWLKKMVDSVEQDGAIDLKLSEAISTGPTRDILGPISHHLDDACETTVEQIISAADDYIRHSGWSGTKVTYEVSAQTSTKEQRITFMLEMPSRAPGERPRRTNTPDMEGVTRHMLDINLDLTYGIVDAAQMGKASMEREIERLTRRVRELEQMQFMWMREAQTMMTDNARREILINDSKSKIEGSKALADVLKQIALPLAPLIAGPQYAQAASMIAAFTAQATAPGGGGAGGVAGALIPGSPGDTATAESNLVDELIRELEDDQAYFGKLFEVLGEKPKCAQLLMAIYQLSNGRRQKLAAQQAAQAAQQSAA
jgi:hypothetical protein